MPLGYSGYWDFDLSGYEDALMELAGAQRRANRMTWPEFLSGLGQTVSQNMLLKNQLEQQEWQRAMKEREMGLSERRWDTMEDYYGAQMEQWNRPQVPNTPFALWRQQNPDADVSEWVKLNQQQAGDQRTAYEKNLALAKQNKIRHMQLRELFDEGGMFRGSPQQFAEFKVLDAEFGQPATTEDTTTKKYRDYVEDYLKKDLVQRQQAGPMLDPVSYRQAMETGVVPGATTNPISPAYLAQFKSYEEWYNSLNEEDRAAITPEEEQILRRHYGTVR